jgi:hypothetical protein
MGVKNYLIDGVSCAECGRAACVAMGRCEGQHATKEGLPAHASIIDATAPIAGVVDTILDYVNRV